MPKEGIEAFNRKGVLMTYEEYAKRNTPLQYRESLINALRLQQQQLEYQYLIHIANLLM